VAVEQLDERSAGILDHSPVSHAAVLSCLSPPGRPGPWEGTRRRPDLFAASVLHDRVPQQRRRGLRFDPSDKKYQQKQHIKDIWQ
jgi:predicted anti-sigma-YlaC factor YlaD